MEFLEYCLITNCCLLTKTDPRLEKWAHQLWKYWLTQISEMGSPVVCGFGETILEILACPYFQYGLAHISIMGVVLVCGFCETILEILARP